MSPESDVVPVLMSDYRLGARDAPLSRRECVCASRRHAQCFGSLSPESDASKPEPGVNKMLNETHCVSPESDVSPNLTFTNCYMHTVFAAQNPSYPGAALRDYKLYGMQTALRGQCAESHI